jgi:hypothetical protein
LGGSSFFSGSEFADSKLTFNIAPYAFATRWSERSDGR